MRRDSFLVTDDGSTPEMPLVACLYCGVPVGAEHAPGCVMRRRTVVLRATVEFVAVECEDIDGDAIAFYYNDGTWCADNLPALLERHVGGLDDHACLCGATTIEYVREATEDDEARSAIRVADLTD